MEQRKLIRSNCLIQSIKVRLQNKGSKIGVDLNSPSKLPSFYCDVEKRRFRFRRKIMRKGNTNLFWFKGYTHIEIK